MVTETVLKLLVVYFLNDNVFALPGPRVYVVTPAAPRPFQVEDAKPAPFYYRNWMRRMDDFRENATTTSTTTSAPRVKTPDLIFAEFESDGSMKKSIRNLLENERVMLKTSTSQPIYVPESEHSKATTRDDYGLPLPKDTDDNIENQSNDYFSMSNNLHNKAQAPVYLPSTTQRPTTITSSTPSTSTSAANVEDIWHIIDSEKLNEERGKWDEVPLPSHEYTSDDQNAPKIESEAENTDPIVKSNNDDDQIDENFALPGFTRNPGSGAENESRAIRTEQNIRFPYVNLKPFQMKHLKKPMVDKKGNNLYSSLDNFFDIKKPVRGEAQDVGTFQMNQPIDRYNPAQPYLPQQYASKSKQSSPNSPPLKATASLVPPPPPPISGPNFPSPVSYDAFPPYASDSDVGASPSFPPAPDSQPAPVSFPAPPPALAPAPLPSPPIMAPSYKDLTDTYSGPSVNNDEQPMDLGYRYKTPSPPSPPAFLPTIPPMSKPFNGYSYNKPAMPSNDNSMMPMDNQEFHGYHYSKPKPTLQAPPVETYDSPPKYGNSDSSPTYGSAPIYGQSNASPGHHDYPELVYEKDHGHMDDSNGNDFKDAGMMPPPVKPDAYDAPPNDHGFPSDFPTDFKFPHDFDHDDHDDHFHHDHETTTSTTEMPRVNRFSYYYLGKKLYYLPLYFSVYFIVYVGALIIKAVLRHKIVYPNSWRPNSTTATFFSKRSVDEFLSHDNMHEMTGKITHAIATAAEKYMKSKRKEN